MTATRSKDQSNEQASPDSRVSESLCLWISRRFAGWQTRSQPGEVR
jgi:hypothetical protein